MDAGLKCIKGTSICANIIFCIFGLILILLGAVIEWKYNAYESFVGPQIWIIPTILIIAGIVVILINILGMWGAIKGNTCILKTFVVLFFILFLSEIVLCVIVYMQSTNLTEVMQPLFNDSIVHYKEHEYYRHSWNIIQTEFRCCGTYGPSDWGNYFPNTTLPSSCCTIINLNEADTCTMMHAHQEGCLPTLLAWLDNSKIVLIVIALGLVGFQLLLMLFACCLHCSSRRDYQEVRSA